MNGMVDFQAVTGLPDQDLLPGCRTPCRAWKKCDPMWLLLLVAHAITTGRYALLQASTLQQSWSSACAAWASGALLRHCSAEARRALEQMECA